MPPSCLISRERLSSAGINVLRNVSNVGAPYVADLEYPRGLPLDVQGAPPLLLGGCNVVVGQVVTFTV